MTKDMCQLLKQIDVKAAKKDHDCMASDWIREGLPLGTNTGFSFTELRQIAISKNDGWRILKGTPYIRQSVIHGSEFTCFKARPEIHAICIEHDLYPEC